MYKITYFNIHGKAELIRMLLKHAKVQFIDDRIGKDTFTSMKASGALPVG